MGHELDLRVRRLPTDPPDGDHRLPLPGGGVRRTYPPGVDERLRPGHGPLVDGGTTPRARACPAPCAAVRQKLADLGLRGSAAICKGPAPPPARRARPDLTAAARRGSVRLGQRYLRGPGRARRPRGPRDRSWVDRCWAERSSASGSTSRSWSRPRPPRAPRDWWDRRSDIAEPSSSADGSDRRPTASARLRDPRPWCSLRRSRGNGTGPRHDRLKIGRRQSPRAHRRRCVGPGPSGGPRRHAGMSTPAPAPRSLADDTGPRRPAALAPRPAGRRPRPRVRAQRPDVDPPTGRRAAPPPAPAAPGPRLRARWPRA